MIARCIYFFKNESNHKKIMHGFNHPLIKYFFHLQSLSFRQHFNFHALLSFLYPNLNHRLFCFFWQGCITFSLLFFVNNSGKNWNKSFCYNFEHIIHHFVDSLLKLDNNKEKEECKISGLQVEMLTATLLTKTELSWIMKQIHLLSLFLSNREKQNWVYSLITFES